MSTYNTGNPLGSTDPRDLYDNAQNLDEAVNDLNAETWTDRLGNTRPTLKLLDDLQSAAGEIISAGDDVTLAYQAAIQNDVAYRMPESAVSYTTSLAQGGPENRTPLKYSDLRVSDSGLAFQISAPSLVARRAMFSVPANRNRIIEVSILTGVSGSEQPEANGLFKVGVAWYTNSRIRLSDPDESIFLETEEALSTSSYRVSFTIGSVDADIYPPSGAAYGIPFFEYTGTGFWFWASEMSITDITQRRQIEQLQQSEYASLLSLIDDETTADVFDFTNPAFASRRPRLGEDFPSHRSFVGDATISGDVETVRVGNTLMPGQLADTGGRLYYTASKPLLPETGDFTFFGSTLMEGDQTGNRTLIWQNVGGEVGRVQCMLNGGFNGSIQTTINEVVGIWAAGMSDGGGVDGYPSPGAAVRGQPVNYVVVMRDGERASEFWLNGRLIDRFTRPTSIAQSNSVLMGQGGAENQSGRSYGRFGVIHRALDAEEVRIAGQWCADAYSDKWDREFLEGQDPVPHAFGGVSYLISPPSAPQKLNQYSEMRPLYLSSYQQVLYPASMTKVLTSMVLLDNISDMDSTIEMMEGDETGGSGNNINAGDILTISDALYNLMLPSSNVTATVVARTVGEILLDGEAGDPVARFVEEMNRKARSLGMLNSNFTNASGLSNSEMVTTAEDMGRLCANVPNYPDLFSRWGAVSHTLNITGADPRTVEISHSASQVMVDDDYQGGKTGTVSSSPLGSTTRNFMWIGRAPNGNYTANVVMLVTSDDRYDASNGLNDYVFSNLRWPIKI